MTRPDIKIKNSTIWFPSGVVKHVDGGVVGIDGNGEIYRGYTDTFSVFGEDDEISFADKVALADFMIKRWSQYRLLAVMDLDKDEEFFPTTNNARTS